MQTLAGNACIWLAREVQLLKAPLPMVVRPSGSVSVVREVQPWNALLPMLVRLSGSVSVVREVQL